MLLDDPAYSASKVDQVETAHISLSDAQLACPQDHEPARQVVRIRAQGASRPTSPALAGVDNLICTVIQPHSIATYAYTLIQSRYGHLRRAASSGGVKSVKKGKTVAASVTKSISDRLNLVRICLASVCLCVKEAERIVGLDYVCEDGRRAGQCGGRWGSSPFGRRACSFLLPPAYGLHAYACSN